MSIKDLALSGVLRPPQVIAASVGRVLFCITLLHFYLSSLGDRDFIWGSTEAINELGLRISGRGLDFVLLGAILLSGYFLLFGGSVLALLNCVALLFIHQLNTGILDGGDNFIRIAAILFPFMITNNYTWRFRFMGKWRADPPPGSFRRSVHNLAMMMVGFQLAVVYTVAGWTKFFSEVWRDGSAMHLISRIEEFQYLPSTLKLYEVPLVSAITGWIVVASQIVFLPLVVFRRTRLIAICAVLCMHIGIAVSLGLVGFSLAMITGLAIIVPDAQYRNLIHRFRESRIRLRFARA